MNNQATDPTPDATSGWVPTGHPAQNPQSGEVKEAPKPPLDPAQIQALLDAAAMQANATSSRRPPYKALGIVCAVVVVLLTVLIMALQWMLANR